MFSMLERRLCALAGNLRNCLLLMPVAGMVILLSSGCTGVGEYFREMCIRLNNELRACYPADFCNIMQSVGEYESRPMKVTPAELDRAAALYFTKTKKFVDS